MSKLVIVGKMAETGEKRVFSDLDEACSVCGLSRTSISLACRDGVESGGWRFRRVERVYAVRLKVGGEWRLVVENGRGTGYLEVENPLRRVGAREVDKIKDITIGWYYE